MFALKIDQGKALPLEQPSLSNTSSGQSFIWIHLEGELELTRNWLAQHNEMDPHTLSALCDEMTRPRVFLNNAEELVVTQRAAYYANENDFDLVSLRAWITDKMLITVSKVTVPSVSILADKLATKAKGINSSFQLFWQLTNMSTELMTSHVIDLDESLNTLEDDWEARHQLDSDTLISIRYSISKISKFLSPQLETFQKMAYNIEEIMQVKKEKNLHQNRWRETINATKRDIESLNEMRERVSILKDALHQRTNETTNRAIFLLSLMATFFLPLTFVASLLGMNVSGIPAHDHPYAFLGVCIFMLIVFCLQWVAFKRWHLLN